MGAAAAAAVAAAKPVAAVISKALAMAAGARASVRRTGRLKARWKLLRLLIGIPALAAVSLTCTDSRTRTDGGGNPPTPVKQAAPAANAANEGAPIVNSGRVIHVLVALCDNVNQGIVPVPARLGNGEDLQQNLYWGAAYGVKAFFKNSRDWRLVAQQLNIRPAILERCIFRHQTKDVYLVADAYRGADIREAIETFFAYAAGERGENARYPQAALRCGGGADLLAYVGHNGLMDFSLAEVPAKRDERQRDAIMLCCASQQYFAAPLRRTGATPLLWTTNLMAPEAYVLRAAIDGWLARESGESIRQRAAAAYHAYQRCGLKAAGRLFASGWRTEGSRE